MNNEFLFVCLLYLIGAVVSPPVQPKGKARPNEHATDTPNFEDLGIGYMRYLQQVMQALEDDKDFAQKLKNVSQEDILSGKVAQQLQFANHGVRSKLDELKRIEMERLQHLKRVEQNKNNGQLIPPPGDGREWWSLSEGDGIEVQRMNAPHHVNLDLKSFEVEDLQKLINAAAKDIQMLNEKGKEEFKRYEMEKERSYREELKNMTEDDRKVAEAQHQELKDKHRDHPEVHHPGSKQQLEQVWEEVDNLPKEEFDPKTFFRMHDLNGDGYWDEVEVKGLVALEVRKMYNLSNIEDDPIEMQEEYNRMEEHIFNETDTNRDHLITLDEFIDLTRKSDFERDSGWKGIDEEEIYTPEELEAYEREFAEQSDSPAASQADQQHVYQPVEGAVPSNQGVQFQPLQVPEGQPVPPVAQPAPPAAQSLQPNQNPVGNVEVPANQVPEQGNTN